MSERHHCEMCGGDLDNGHEYGPLGDYSYLCQTCERKLMQQDPERYPLMKKPTFTKWIDKRGLPIGTVDEQGTLFLANGPIEIRDPLCSVYDCHVKHLDLPCVDFEFICHEVTRAHGFPRLEPDELLPVAELLNRRYGMGITRVAGVEGSFIHVRTFDER